MWKEYCRAGQATDGNVTNARGMLAKNTHTHTHTHTHTQKHTHTHTQNM